MGGLLKNRFDNKFEQKLKKRKFKKLKIWQLLLIIVIMLFVDATFLRIDHLKMVDLRDAVLAADESEDDEAISSALENLKSFTFSHVVINISESNGKQEIMFGTGTFYLEHQYRRAAATAIEKAEEELLNTNDSPNGNVYAAASNVCRARALENGWYSWTDQRYIDCMTSEIAKYPTYETLTDQLVARIPSTELYRKNYASPIWSPSLSGFAILITLILVIIVIIRAIIWVFLRLAILFL